MGSTIDDFLELVQQLSDVTSRARMRYTQFDVRGKTFAYLWEATATVGLCQTIAEQIALVSERPRAFEVQYTSPRFGWVVAHLEHVDRDELGELLFEAWRLLAPPALAEDSSYVVPR